MRIGFLIARNVYFRSFGPVIDGFLQKGHSVFCLHDYSQPKGGSKGYQFPDIAQTPFFRNGQVFSLEFSSERDFIDKVLQNSIELVFSLDFIEAHFNLREELAKKGVFWAALQNGFDSGPHSGKNLSMPDRFFVYSSEWLEWMFEYLKKAGKTKEENFSEFEKKLRERVKPVGFWTAEQKSIIDPTAVRKKWGIGAGKKVVLLLPFPFGSSIDRFWTKYVFGWHNVFSQLPLALFSFNKRWIKQVMGKENDFRVSLAIKRFCERNNCFLLVKCRKKDPAKKYLIKMADKILFDGGFYPSTIIECFSVADVCFNFYSTAAIEAAAMGVSNVCIAPDVSDWKDIRNVLWQTILEKENDFFGFLGVSYLKSIAEIIRELPQKTFSDFPLDKEKQSRYLQKFAGGLSGGAVAKIVSEIEKLIQK
ncbi:MAG: hypothetical protein M1127_02725 [Patescibacteria group bacterium]|nr:hypothetical protein [Patescibacteria group bacterium]